MPGGVAGRQAQKTISASVPLRLIARVMKILETHDEWVNMSDFVREAIADKANTVDAEDAKRPRDLELERRIVGQAKPK